MEPSRKTNAWAESMKILLLGNGIVANLAEPLVQIEEMVEKLPILRELMVTGLEKEKQNLVVDELQRQLQYLNQFNEKIKENITKMMCVVEGEAER
jgi:hypothetical protein